MYAEKNIHERELAVREKELNVDRVILANNIATYRRKMNLSRAELAQKTGLTEASIGQYERGGRVPQISILCRIADALNVSLDVLASHDSKSYDAVKEYRFDKACEFVRSWNYKISCDENDSVTLFEESLQPDFYFENGIITQSGNDKKRLKKIITFKTRQDFLSFVEKIMTSFLSALNGGIIFDHALNNLLNGENFLRVLNISSTDLDDPPF